MAYNKKSLENLRDIDNSDPLINEAKSLGQRYKNVVIRALREGIAARNMVDKTLDVAEEELDKGNCKPALKLIEIAKEPDKQEVKLDSTNIIPPVINILPVKGTDEL